MRERARLTAVRTLPALLWGALLVLVGVLPQAAAPASAADRAVSSPAFSATHVFGTAEFPDPGTELPGTRVSGTTATTMPTPLVVPGHTARGTEAVVGSGARNAPVPRTRPDTTPGSSVVRGEAGQGPVTTVRLAAVGEHSGRPVLPPPAPGGPVVPGYEQPAPRGTVLAVWHERGPPAPSHGPRSTRAPPYSRSS
ncbi:hypothetical protein ACIP88_18085 [Streptomyces uncialis]|uniref:hypothetical protein n=1 Tax=Streptomyces uncialis TaxID=1048205 RepID=UPI00382A89BA